MSRGGSRKPDSLTVDSPQNPTDVHVGARIRTQRTMLGLSVAELAGMLGVTTRQVSRMELGAERVGAPRLLQLSQMLGMPVSWFFNGIGPEGTAEYGGRLPANISSSHAAATREQFELLVTYFTNIQDADTRKLIVEMARRLADCEAKSLPRASIKSAV
jgi:transcriptional regulator with XRE-family HTH domain